MFIYENGVLKVYYYRTLTRIDPHEIVIYYSQYNLLIEGQNLSLSFFEKDELHIIGEIVNIKMEHKNEKK